MKIHWLLLNITLLATGILGVAVDIRQWLTSWTAEAPGQYPLSALAILILAALALLAGCGWMLHILRRRDARVAAAMQRRKNGVPR